MTDGRTELVPQTTPLERGGNAPLPDEVLDALVMVLDEIRLGRSRSRSELVTRTGLGRAIVARRVQELIDRGLVTEGDVGAKGSRFYIVESDSAIGQVATDPGRSLRHAKLGAEYMLGLRAGPKTQAVGVESDEPEHSHEGE